MTMKNRADSPYPEPTARFERLLNTGASAPARQRAAASCACGCSNCYRCGHDHRVGQSFHVCHSGADHHLALGPGLRAADRIHCVQHHLLCGHFAADDLRQYGGPACYGRQSQAERRELDRRDPFNPCDFRVQFPVAALWRYYRRHAGAFCFRIHPPARLAQSGRQHQRNGDRLRFGCCCAILHRDGDDRGLDHLGRSKR